MDLDELCRSEGLDPEALEETVAWARARADELVAGLVADAELGPILDAVWEEESALNVLPPLDAAEHDSDESEPAVGEASAALEVAPPPDYDDGHAYAEPASSSEVPAEAEDAAEHAAQDDGAANAEPTTLRDMIADGARPVLGLPPIPGSYQAAPMKEMTQEIDADEIEMLDDDELELMMDDEPAEAPTNEPPPSGGGDGDVPEWQQALNSAQLGGGSQADHDSGLLRIHPPGTRPPEPDE